LELQILLATCTVMNRLCTWHPIACIIMNLCININYWHWISKGVVYFHPRQAKCPLCQNMTFMTRTFCNYGPILVTKFCVMSQYHLGDLSYSYNYQPTCLPTYVPTLILPTYLPTYLWHTFLPSNFLCATYLPTYLFAYLVA